jgi:hypothetical protein
MKLGILLSILIGSSAFALEMPTRKICSARETMAQKNLRLVNQRFGAGEVTRVDVLRLELDLLDIELTCGDLIRGSDQSASSYCGQAIGKVADFVKGISEETLSGQSTDRDKQLAEFRQIDVQAICE